MFTGERFPKDENPDNQTQRYYGKRTIEAKI